MLNVTAVIGLVVGVHGCWRIFRSVQTAYFTTPRAAKINMLLQVGIGTALLVGAVAFSS